MKKAISILAALALSASAALAREPAAFRGGVKTNAVGSELQFEVNVDPEEKQVVVVPLSDRKLDPPPVLRMKFLTEDAEKSVPVVLKTISKPNTGGVSYGGKLDIWNSSYIGFEIQFSFDRKHWKKVSHEFSRDQKF